MPAPIRYARTEDGFKIPYWELGEGPPLLLTCPINYSHIELELKNEYLRGWYEAVTSRHRVVRFDSRGWGLAEPIVGYTINGVVRDMEAVVAATGLEKFALFGFYGWGPAAITYAARHPEQVSHLVLISTLPGMTMDYLNEDKETKALNAITSIDWNLYLRALAHATVGWTNAALAEEFAAHIGESISQKYMLSMREEYENDATDDLGHVACPTLVVARRGDPVWTLDRSKEIASGIPNSELRIVETQTPSVVGPEFAPTLQLIEEFLGTPGVAAVPDKPDASLLRTVLFTDLVGHTEMMQRLGDDRGRDVLREHERITREVLKANGGTEVKTMGDGFMASFGSVTRAVECAIALQRAFADREGEPLNVRVGLNAGEPIEEDGDLFGATVVLASRIAANAAGGEILVADTVRGLCSGKGFLFADRGDFVAKGIEEPVRISEVNWHS